MIVGQNLVQIRSYFQVSDSSYLHDKKILWSTVSGDDESSTAHELSSQGSISRVHDDKILTFKSMRAAMRIRNPVGHVTSCWLPETRDVAFPTSGDNRWRGGLYAGIWGVGR